MELLSWAFWLILSIVLYAYLGHGIVFGMLAWLKKSNK